jgi:hypothetical protein
MINEFVQAGVWILLPFVGGVVTGIIAMAIALSMMGRSEEEMECENCEVVEMCRRMFGKYWNDKSNGGKGCRHPPEKLPLAAGAMENPETESPKAGASRKGKYVPREGEVEKLGKPHAVSCSGKAKVPQAETPGRTNRPADVQVHGIAPTPAHRTKSNFIQEELI